MIRLGVLGSTRGSSLMPVLHAIADGSLSATIALVGSDRPDAGILTKATHCQLPSCVGNAAQLSTALKDAGVELVVLVGYMKILPPSFIADWPRKIINVHPSLLPKHAGLINLAVHQSVLASGDAETGCTVHYVDEGVDTGDIILQRRCPVASGDTPASLKSKVQALEGPALIAAIEKVIHESRKHTH